MTTEPKPADLSVLLTAMNEVMKAATKIVKTGTNDFHKYSYASEEDALDALRPHLTEHGLILIPSLDGKPFTDQQGNTHLRMAYTLAHVSGAIWPRPIIFPGCGNDRAKTGAIGDKGVYKAMTGANKYMLFKLFQIPTGDDPEVASAHDKGAKAKADAAPGEFNKTDEAKWVRWISNYCKRAAEVETLEALEALQAKHAQNLTTIAKNGKEPWKLQINAVTQAALNRLQKPATLDEALDGDRIPE